MIDTDLESRGAEIAETPPPTEEDDLLVVNDDGELDPDFPVYEETPEPSISVPTDSTEVEPTDEKAALAELLTSKQVSVTALTEDGGRGLRLFLGKPTMSTFENMLRRSTHGVVIEADPRREGVSVTWQK